MQARWERSATDAQAQQKQAALTDPAQPGRAPTAADGVCLAQARAELGAAEAAHAQLRQVQAALAELAAGLPAAGGAAEAGAAVRRVAAELHELHRCGSADGSP